MNGPIRSMSMNYESTFQRGINEARQVLVGYVHINPNHEALLCSMIISNTSF